MADLPTQATAEQAIVLEINQQRRRRGMQVVRSSRLLIRAASRHTSDLVRHHMLSHSSSDGTSFAARITRWLRARLFGETIAFTPRGSTTRVEARRIVSAWMRSPGHRRELLERSYRWVGVDQKAGEVAGRSGEVTTADFATSDLKSR